MKSFRADGKTNLVETHREITARQHTLTLSRLRGELAPTVLSRALTQPWPALTQRVACVRGLGEGSWGLGEGTARACNPDK
ncbi:hypothetical protein E2C01_097403 [Portunus trituberculatus]|uniref:Uncharacterized protein n=1 Tax=Portunus trituberculatus TaxID=210409 RepID=A0A5B7K9H0_PORTR|nr:hypothetical protein [Portunus trituberculatus]